MTGSALIQSETGFAIATPTIRWTGTTGLSMVAVPVATSCYLSGPIWNMTIVGYLGFGEYVLDIHN